MPCPSQYVHQQFFDAKNTQDNCVMFIDMMVSFSKKRILWFVYPSMSNLQLPEAIVFLNEAKLYLFY
jgi:hypothetical protein